MFPTLIVPPCVTITRAIRELRGAVKIIRVQSFYSAGAHTNFNSSAAAAAAVTPVFSLLYCYSYSEVNKEPFVSDGSVWDCVLCVCGDGRCPKY